jgi:hypothetical protein
VRPEADAASSTHFSTWRRTHPIMRSVNLDGILVSPPMRLGLPDSPQINATALAWGDSSNSTAGTSPLIALLEPVGGPAAARDNASPDAAPSTLGGVKRLVLAFELAQTNWGIEFSFPVFMVNAVEYLALQQTGLVSRSYRTQEPISLSVAASAVPTGAREAAVDGPLKLTVPIRRTRTGAIQNPNENAPVEIVVGSLERAGVYAVRAGGVDLPSGSGAIAVNLVDSWESRAAVATGLDLPESPAARQSAAEAESRREVWHWLVAFALVLLAIEWVFFTRGMRA